MRSHATPTARHRHRLMGVLVSTVLHCTAVVTLAAAFGSIFLNDRAMELLPEVWSDAALQPDVMASALIVVGLAACTWAMGNLLLALIRTRTRQRKLTPSTIKLQRGTIITETLVVLPVLLLLAFGLAQMGINSMAGLLASVAAYESGRTVAVWGPEVGHNRSGGGTVTHAIVEDRARIAAAGILTPIVPNLASGMCNVSQAMTKVQEGMVGALVPTGVPVPRTSISTMAEAFGDASFSDRGFIQFRLAYCATTVTYTHTINTDPDLNDRNVFTTRVQYAHPNAMPIAGRVFTNAPGAGPWITPYVALYDRQYQLTQQLSPNPIRPQANIVRRLINNIPSPF